MNRNQNGIETKPITMRWIPLLGGILGSTTCGMLLYAWSIFIRPLSNEFGWSRSEIALAFSICCLVFGLVTFPAGKISDKLGPRPVVILGGFLVGIGFFLSSFVQSKLQLYTTYGVIAGLGGGLIYLPPIATAPKWWPDRRALATGFAVVGLGLGSFIMGPLSTWIMANYGWRSVFAWCGIAMGIMAITSGLLLSTPPKDWIPKGWSPDKTSTQEANHKNNIFSHSEAIRTSNFWLLYISYFFCAFAGLMVIGHIAAHGRDLGLTSMEAAGAVSALAFTNAATRVLSGWFADKFGVKSYFATLIGLQAIALSLLYPLGGNYWALWFISATIGWNYGAMFTLFPATTLEFYGPKDQGSNYGLLFTAYGLAGFAGPWIGGWIKDSSGSYCTAFLASAVVTVTASIIIATLKPPKKNEKF